MKRLFKNDKLRTEKSNLKGVYWVSWTADLTEHNREWLKANCRTDSDFWIFYLSEKDYQEIFGKCS